MTNYTIIEDCSPYYIRFTYDGIEKLINLCKEYIIPDSSTVPFRHIKLPRNYSDSILELFPLSKKVPFMKERVSLFLTEPNFYYGPHKDGASIRFGINFGVSILDDKCETRWYNDEDLKDYTVSTDFIPWINAPISNTSREILGWDRNKHTPAKIMVAKPNEGILFNTEIFHEWDNSKSDNRRVILTLRHSTPRNVYFEDVRKIMFNF